MTATPFSVLLWTLLPPRLSSRKSNERRGQFFVEREKVFDALALCLEWLATVAKVNSPV
jgi:hypothetical protein